MTVSVTCASDSRANIPAVSSALEAATKALQDAGAEICEISLPHAEAAVASYYIIACAEASSNLARYDGIRYGHRSRLTHDPDALFSLSRAEGFGEEVKRRIILGTYVLSGGYYDAYYARAQKARALVAQDFAKAFSELGVQLILGPVAPTPAPNLHAVDMTPLQTYLADIYTVPANLAGLPAISVPTPQSGLPVGVQLLAPHFEEARLLRAAATLEQSWK